MLRPPSKDRSQAFFFVSRSAFDWIDSFVARAAGDHGHLCRFRRRCRAAKLDRSDTFVGTAE
jgi:hypothetical protein